jgi:transcriptional regulator with XRE-family HTH domain
MEATSDHRKRRPTGHAHAQEFDGPGLAQFIRGARQEQQLSTRDLARQSGVSQAYVVALERACTANSGTGPSPTPTVDVLTKLAFALGIPADLLFRKSTRLRHQHVLLIADEPMVGSMAAIMRAASPGVTTWLATSPNQSVEDDNRLLPIRLHAPSIRRDRTYHYDSVRVERKLQNELRRHGALLAGAEVGLVFDEMSTVMAALDDPNVILHEERRWAEKVNAAASEVGAHAVWNICVYDVDALRSLPNPIEATNGLIESHDQVWHIRGRQLTKKQGALRNLAAKGLVNAS